MPNWARLRAAVLKNNELAQSLAAIEKIESWLDLGADGALSSCRATVTSEAVAFEFVKALLVLIPS
jgi:hypothetical protein